MLASSLLVLTAAATVAAPDVAAPEVALVALDAPERLAPLLGALGDSERREGLTLLEPGAVVERLTGIRDPRLPDVAALSQMLKDAREREARFDTEGARDLRRAVLAAYDTALWPNAELRRLAADALQEGAAAALADGKLGAAETLALEATTRFPEMPIDAVRQPTAVRELFAAAFEKAKTMKQAPLLVESEADGELLLDGRRMGRLESRRVLMVAPGAHELWVETSAGVGLPRRVDVGDQGGEATLDAAFAGRLALWPVLSLRCEARCDADLVELGRRLGVARVIGARLVEGTEKRVALVGVTVESGETRERVLDLYPAAQRLEAGADAGASPRARFSPLYLLPFGGGQFAQGRTIFGATYLGVEAGLLVWNVVAVRAHNQALANDDFANEPSLRETRNLSAALAAGALVVGVVEAVVVGWLTGEDPEAVAPVAP